MCTAIMLLLIDSLLIIAIVLLSFSIIESIDSVSRDGPNVTYT